MDKLAATIARHTPAVTWHIVLRPTRGERLYEPGEVVETTEWDHVNQLVESRRIAPFPPGVEIPPLTEGENGEMRRWFRESDLRASKVKRSAKPKLTAETADNTKG